MLQLWAVSALTFSSPARPPRTAGSIACRSAALRMTVEDELGILPPALFFDPMGLTDDVRLAQRRALELKHGRACMGAGVALLAAELHRIDLFVPTGGMSAVLLGGGHSSVSVLACARALAPLVRIEPMAALQLAVCALVPFLLWSLPIRDDIEPRRLGRELTLSRAAMLALMGMACQSGAEQALHL